MLIRRKNPHAYCRAHLATQQRLWRQKASWCFRVSKCPEAGKGGKHSDWEATLLPLGAKPCNTRRNLIGCVATSDAAMQLQISMHARESTLTII